MINDNIRKCRKEKGLSQEEMAVRLLRDYPFTRHTGLRLHWTVRDRDTWNMAHKIMGHISLPVALLYVACSLTIDYFEQVSLIAMLLWIGIPGGI